MSEDRVFSRSYFVRLADVTNDREGFLICEVERSKLELKRFKVWSYCGYPNEIEDVSESINGKICRELKRHSMQLMSDENLWDHDEDPPLGRSDEGEIGV